MTATPRASRRRVAEMSGLLHGLLDDIAAAGGPKARAHRAALELVDAFVAGEVPPPEAIAAARAAVTNVIGRIPSGSAPLFAALSYLPIELLLRMVESGDDLSRHVLQHAALAVVGPPTGAAMRVEELRMRAAAVATGIDDTPIAPPPHEITLDGSIGELGLPAVAVAHLASRAASRTGKHAAPDATRALLLARGYQPSPAVLAFEAAYGGLELFESDPDTPALLVGPYAICSALSGNRRADDPVPVVFASNDVYYALDERGRGFTNAAMVEGVFRPSAPDGRALLTQAVLWRALETHPLSFVMREGLHGAAMAEEQGLAPIDEATGETERWWGDASATRLVVEIDRGNGYEGPMTCTAFERR
jgi:hypothetical protein